MAVQKSRLDILANNAANLTTPGYRADVPIVEDFRRLLAGQIERERPYAALVSRDQVRSLGPLGTGIFMTDVLVDLQPGPLRETGDPFDLALGSNSFFSVLAGNQVRYTRDGHFHRDRDGFLVTAEGNLVLAGGQPVQIPDGDMVVTLAGEIYVNGELIGQLDVVEMPPGGRWDKAGFNLFQPSANSPAPQPAATPNVQQGFLELSNVDLEFTTAHIMSSLRLFEAAQRMFQMQDETLGRAVNEIGRFT